MTPLKEIVVAVRSTSVWLSIAVDDVIGRYKRTILGPAWVILPQAAFIVGIYLIHKTDLGGKGIEFLFYLTISLPLWGMIVTFLVEGSASLTSAKGLIESYPLPLAVHVIRVVARAVVTFAHLLVVYFIALLVTRHPLPLTAWAAIPALALIVLFGFGAGLTLGPLGARFRDLGPALGSALSLAFVLTPVFWTPNAAQLNSPLVQLNPFFYLLQVVREPLLGRLGDPSVWLIAGGLALLALLAGVIVYSRERSTILYWL